MPTLAQKMAREAPARMIRTMEVTDNELDELRARRFLW